MIGLGVGPSPGLSLPAQLPAWGRQSHGLPGQEVRRSRADLATHFNQQHLQNPPTLLKPSSSLCPDSSVPGTHFSLSLSPVLSPDPHCLRTRESSFHSKQILSVLPEPGKNQAEEVPEEQHPAYPGASCHHIFCEIWLNETLPAKRLWAPTRGSPVGRGGRLPPAARHAVSGGPGSVLSLVSILKMGI